MVVVFGKYGRMFVGWKLSILRGNAVQIGVIVFYWTWIVLGIIRDHRVV